MNENLDLTKILEGCPEDTNFYSPLFGTVKFYKIIDSTEPMIIVETIDNRQNHNRFSFTTKGNYYNDFADTDCLLFPSKEQRDWSKFERFWDKTEKVERFDPNTLKPFDKILVRKVYTPWNISPWSCEYFNYIHPNTPHLVNGISSKYDICIPYNDETKHLLGTTNDCPEHYKWWKIENDFV